MITHRANRLRFVLMFGAAAAALWIFVDADDLRYLPAHLVVGGLLAGLVLFLVAQMVFHPPAGAGADAPAHTPFPFKSALRRIRARELVDDVLDRVRFRVDTFPNGLYQPVQSLPRAGASRSTGSESRWSAMLPVIRAEGVRSALDIGACEGYFAIELAQAGIPTIALESAPGNYRTILFAIKRGGTRNVGVLAMEITPENVGTLPSSDCVLLLSVWHHLVRSFGIEHATAMLRTIWERTRNVMFFDTGETEMTPDYRLPSMSPDPRSWLTGFLAETCAGSRIEHLGRHGAFDPVGKRCERNLFAVIRDRDFSSQDYA